MSLSPPPANVTTPPPAFACHPALPFHCALSDQSDEWPGIFRCVSAALVCDGVADCVPHGEDEDIALCGTDDPCAPLGRCPNRRCVRADMRRQCLPSVGVRTSVPYGGGGWRAEANGFAWYSLLFLTLGALLVVTSAKRYTMMKRQQTALALASLRHEQLAQRQSLVMSATAGGAGGGGNGRQTRWLLVSIHPPRAAGVGNAAPLGDVPPDYEAAVRAANARQCGGAPPPPLYSEADGAPPPAYESTAAAAVVVDESAPPAAASAGRTEQGANAAVVAASAAKCNGGAEENV